MALGKSIIQQTKPNYQDCTQDLSNGTNVPH